MTDLSVIAEQIAHIEKIANGWCNFALVCAVIGFVLAAACAVYWILLIKKTEVEMPGNPQKTEGVRVAFSKNAKQFQSKT